MSTRIHGSAPGRPGLVVSRCFNHPGREASARCTVCGRFHCRECVAEHAGRMICGSCLRREEAGRSETARRWFGWIARALQAAAAVAVAWLVFYFAGRALVRTPTEFHEGTVWRGRWWQDDAQ